MPAYGFRETWTALVTPFDEGGNVDYEGLQKNIAFQIEQGITGVLPRMWRARRCRLQQHA
jgi:dihydrodipicolinate synthase/N-acetylneuraminate lyase